MAMKLEIMTTERRVKLYFDPAARSVAQFPGSMYPTATRNPGPANATILRQKLAVFGTASERCTSGRLGVSASRRHGLCSGFIQVATVFQFTARARTYESTRPRFLYTHTSMKVLVIGGGGREHA